MGLLKLDDLKGGWHSWEMDQKCPAGLEGKVGESEKRLKRVALATMHAVLQAVLISLAFILITMETLEGTCQRIAKVSSDSKFYIFLCFNLK